MPVPSEADLELWIEESIADVSGRTGYTVARARQEEFLLLFGLVGRTTRFADAFLRLRRAGYSTEAVPLARAALEHAVTAQWAFLTESGIARFHRQVLRERHDHYSKLADWLHDDELRTELSSLGSPPPGKLLPKFTDMMRELDSESFLVTSYHVLSQQVHVTHAAVTGFLHPEGEGLSLKYGQEYPYPFPLVYIVAVACMLARWILACLTADSELLSYLDRRSDELILPLSLASGLKAERKRPGM